jgi:hypothetical protein
MAPTLVSLNSGIGEGRAERLVGLTEENTLIRFDVRDTR